jgi:hypothetical protein
MRRFFGLTLLAILAIPPPAPAGSIMYTFSDANEPHAPLARMEVDGGALARGYFSNADLLGFGFSLFGAADLDPFTLPIAADGTPGGWGTITGRTVVYGSTYSLTADFPAGWWRVSTGSYPGVYGYGYWTARIEAGGPASVPEPSARMMMALAMVLGVVGGIFLYLWIDGEGGDS